jgi:hypothetical protein
MSKMKKGRMREHNPAGGILLLDGKPFKYVDVFRRNEGKRTEYIFFHKTKQVTLIYDQMIDTIDRMFPPAIIQRRLLGLNPTPETPRPPFVDELGFELFVLGPTALTDAGARLQLRVVHPASRKISRVDQFPRPKLTYNKNSGSASWFDGKRKEPHIFSFSVYQNMSFEVFYENWKRGGAPLRGSSEAIPGASTNRFGDVWVPKSGKVRKKHDAYRLGLIKSAGRGLFILDPGYQFEAVRRS